jgi:hypothetical protein
MAQLVYKGVVRGKTIALEEPGDLPEGTEVLVTPLAAAKGSPQAVVAAMDAAPHVKPEDVEELMRCIEEGKRPVHYDNPLARKRKA